MHIERLSLALLVTAAASACSSGSDFQVASDTGGADDAATSDSLGTGDADGAVDPCADEPGKAKFCVTVTAEVGPGYSSTTASTLGLDGKGLLKVFLYDKDPSAGTATAPVVPVATLRYGAIGEKIAIDKLPVTLVDTVAKAGTYWVIGTFGDADRPESDSVAHPGDFVSVPETFDSKLKAVWSKLDVAKDKTTRHSLKLYPMRRLDLELRVASELGAAIRDGKYLANGDGPVLVILYDGTLGGASQVIRWSDVTPCVPTRPKEVLATATTVSIVTPVVGAHSVFAGLLDFPGDTFPPRGMFLPDPTPIKVDIKGADWTASAVVRFTNVADPYLPGDPVVDALSCPPK